MIGGTKFYERAEIKDAVAYLSLLVNPSDQVSFSRVVNSPRRGIGNTSQGRIASHANTTGVPIWEVVGRVEEVPGLGAAAVKAVSRFHELIERAAPKRPTRVRRSPRCSRRRCARAATWKRWRRSGPSKPRGGSRTSRS